MTIPILCKRREHLSRELGVLPRRGERAVGHALGYGQAPRPRGLLPGAPHREEERSRTTN